MRFKQLIRAILAIAFIVTVTSCLSNDKENDTNVLFPDITIGNFVNTQIPLSEIISDYRMIPLETTDESLIGGWSNKIMKKDGPVFVSSGNEVLMFDEGGKFQSKLSAVMEQAIVIRHGSNIKEYRVWPENKSMIIDDICERTDSRFLLTFGACESDDSFLFIIPSEEDDANPSLLEVKKLK